MRKSTLLVMAIVMAITMAVAAPTTYAQHLPPIYSDEPADPIPFEAIEVPSTGFPATCDGCSDIGCTGACQSDSVCCEAEGFKCRQQAKWWGFPGEFHELPLGAATHTIFESQVLRGAEARLTLYDYDFIPGMTTLSAHGRARLTRLAALAQQWGGGNIVIQTVDAHLDAQRLLHVQTMATDSLGLHPDQVALATPIAAGLHGEEATIIRENLLEQTRQSGVRQFNFGSFSSQMGFSAGGTR